MDAKLLALLIRKTTLKNWAQLFCFSSQTLLGKNFIDDLISLMLEPPTPFILPPVQIN